MKHRFDQALVIIAFCILPAGAASANELQSQFDEFQAQAEGGGPVIQKALKQEGRFVPIVIPISNPTVGTGLGGGVLYMHAKDQAADPDNPSTMTGVFGMYTDTESWAVGGFHSGSYKDDTVRVSVPVVHGDFSLKFYGIGDNSPLRDDPLDYDAFGNMFIPRASFELPYDNWFMGGLYRIIDIETRFGEGEPVDVPGLDEKQTTAGFGLISLFDTRNSNLWPTQGRWMDITATYNGEYAGGNYNYLRLIMKWAQYIPLHDSFTGLTDSMLRAPRLSGTWPGSGSGDLRAGSIWIMWRQRPRRKFDGTFTAAGMFQRLEVPDGSGIRSVM
jgi:hypothetical protein